MAETRPAFSELRGLPGADLQAQLGKLRQERWQLRVKTKEGTAQQTHHAALIRRQIARIMTALREQQLKQTATR